MRCAKRRTDEYSTVSSLNIPTRDARQWNMNANYLAYTYVYERDLRKQIDLEIRWYNILNIQIKQRNTQTLWFRTHISYLLWRRSLMGPSRQLHRSKFHIALWTKKKYTWQWKKKECLVKLKRMDMKFNIRF